MPGSHTAGCRGICLVRRTGARTKSKDLTVDPLEAPGLRSLVLVLGTARSGSTMLDLILGAAPGASSLGEVSALFRPFRGYHLDWVCRCGDRSCSSWAPLRKMPEFQFHEQAFRVRDAKVLVDSSKRLCWAYDSIRWSRVAQPPHRVVGVVIWKHPLNLISSWEKRGRCADETIRAFTNYYSRVLSLEIPLVAVRLEALTQYPESTTEALCRRLGLSFDASMLRFWESDYHHVFGSSSVLDKSRLAETGIAALATPSAHGLGRSTRLRRLIQALLELDVTEEDKGSYSRGVLRRGADRLNWRWECQMKDPIRRRRMLRRALAQVG